MVLKFNAVIHVRKQINQMWCDWDVYVKQECYFKCFYFVISYEYISHRMYMFANVFAIERKSVIYALI